MKLSPTQINLMLILAGKNLLRRRESDGSFMPLAAEKRTVDSLAKQELLRWVHAGKDGFTYNGVVLTAAGRAALQLSGHL